MSNWIILLREVMEISLLLSIFFASVKNIMYKNYAILFGIFLGSVFSVIFGLSISFISDCFEGRGQEIFQLLILSLSIGLIYLNLRWIKKNVGEKKYKLTKLNVKSEVKYFWIISLMVSLIILREGLEIFLFIYGTIISKQNSHFFLLSELIFGSLIGIFIGFICHKFLIKIPYKYILNITSWFLIFLASNMSVSLLNIISSIDLINFDNSPIWDSSNLLSENSFMGKILCHLIGYNSKPSLPEIIIYGASMFIFVKARENGQLTGEKLIK